MISSILPREAALLRHRGYTVIWSRFTCTHFICEPTENAGGRKCKCYAARHSYGRGFGVHVFRRYTELVKELHAALGITCSSDPPSCGLAVRAGSTKAALGGQRLGQGGRRL